MFDNLFWALYWIDILSDLGKNVMMAVPLAAVIGLMGFLIFLTYHNEWDLPNPSVKTMKRTAQTAVAAWVIMVFLSFIPSKTTMYMMLGVKATKDFTQTEMGKKLEVYINQEMDKLLGKGAK